MVKPSRLSSPSEPSLYSSWTDHHPGGHHQHHLHHPGSDHLVAHQNHSNDDGEHVHHQVAMKNGVTSAGAPPPASMQLNLWNSNNNEDASNNEETNHLAEDDNRHPSAANEINDLSSQHAALSPSAIGSIKGNNNNNNNNNHLPRIVGILTKERKENFVFLFRYLLFHFFFFFFRLPCHRPHPKKQIVYVFICCVFQEQKRKFLSLYTLHLEVYKETRFYPVHSPDSLTFSFSLLFLFISICFFCFFKLLNISI